MFRTVRPWLISVICSSVALLAAAFFYSKQFPKAAWIWTAALPALFLETLFYLGSVFEITRSFFARIRGRWRKATLLFVSALLPYLVFALGSYTLRINAFFLLAALVAVLSLWHVILPRRLSYDLGFLVVAAAPFVSRVFKRIYLSPEQHLGLDILGHLMWIRVGLVALLVLREWNPGPVSLWPKRTEWRAGAFWFMVVLVPLTAIALGIHDVGWSPSQAPWWKVAAIAIGTFFGILWVVALGEELFFRGVVERALLNYHASPLAAITIATLLFGTAHLWFHQFPDWRRAISAGILGIGCGLAYWQTGSIRASMVTHAFAVTTWRVLFK